MSYLNEFKLDGRAALITGGGSGIGRECALTFAEAGASVFITGRREEKLREVQDLIHRNGGICEYAALDVSTEANCKKMVEQAADILDGLDIVVNSAGVRGSHGDIEEEFSAANLESTMGVDFNSVFFTVKYAYKFCAGGGHGSIINIASLAALRGSGPIVYSAAKGAVKSMGKSLAKRLGSMNIRVNTIYPGLIITEMNEKMTENPEMVEHFKKESPLGLLGDPRDISLCALYLASDASRFVTGQDFVIDGGAMC